MAQFSFYFTVFDIGIDSTVLFIVNGNLIHNPSIIIIHAIYIVGIIFNVKFNTFYEYSLSFSLESESNV